MKQFYSKLGNELSYNSELSLTEIANSLQTDKGTLSRNDVAWANAHPTHHCWHYTPVYEKYMNPKRESKVKLLEIGVCDPRFCFASPKMWLQYFKDVDLYSVDNFWGRGFSESDIEPILKMGTNFIYADQGSSQDWDIIVENVGSAKLDFIVEDGSHQPHHMMYSLYRAIDVLKPGGIFFMEDIQNPETSRGTYGYDNANIILELQNWGEHYVTQYLTIDQSNLIRDNYELIELPLDPSRIKYLACFRKK